MEQRVRPTGRTSWRRLAAVLVPTAVAGGMVLGGIAEGVVGVSFTSGSPFTVTVDQVRSDGLRIVPGASAGDPGLPTLLATLPAAELSGLCQSVTADLPVVGRVTTVLRSPHVRTTDLVLEVRGITGGLDVSRLLVGPLADADGTPGYQAGETTLTNLKISAGAVTAGTFTVTDLDLSYHAGDEGCSSTPDGQGR